MEANEGSATILIGSRALNKDFDGAHNADRDWDLIMDWEQIRNNFYKKKFVHFKPHWDQGKFSAVHYSSGARVEVEMMDKFESCSILNALSQSQVAHLRLQNQSVFLHGLTQAKIWSIDAAIPSKNTLLVLKASHIYFPVNWRKNFLQFASIVSSLKNQNLTEVIKFDPNSDLLKKLFQLRARETLQRIRSQIQFINQRNVPDIKVIVEDIKEYYKREFVFKEIQLNEKNEDDTFYLPTTGLKLSKSAWSKLNEEKKCQFIEEQLILIAFIYYLPLQRKNGILSQFKKKYDVVELFLLCLETLITQQVSSVLENKPKTTEYTSCLPIEGSQICDEADAYGLLPIASLSDLAKTTFANPVVNWLLNNINKIAEDFQLNNYHSISESFRGFITANSALMTYSPTLNPHLPFEIIDIIADAGNDHVILLKLGRVCKTWKKYFNSNEKWKRICDRLDPDTSAIAKSQAAKKYPMINNDYKLIYKEGCSLMNKAHSSAKCKHCDGWHDLRSRKNPDPNEDEAYWEYCVCDDCDAGSWQSCEQYTDFLFQ